MSEEYDVIMVGASLTGLCMTNYLANKGLRILLIDLKSIKRIGEGVSGKILSEEAVLFLKNAFNIRIPAKFINKEVNNTSIGSINNVKMEVSNHYYIIDKKLFSTYLLGKIIDYENVNVLERCMITEVIEEGRSFSGITIKNLARGTLSDFRGKIIVDASGSTAVLRRKIPHNRFFEKDLHDFDRAVIQEELLETSEKISNPKIIFDPSKINAGNIWVVSEGDNRISISMEVPGKSEMSKKDFEDYKNLLINNKEAKLLSSRTGLISIRRPLNSFVFKNALLVGSSACQVNPLITRDISFGIRGAYYASKAILSAMKKEVISTETLWSYNISYMREYGWKNATLECVRDFFASLSTETLDFIIDNRIVPPNLLESLEGRLKKRELLFNNAKLFLKPRLLNKFVKLSDYSKHMKFLYDNYPDYDEFENWKKKLNNELRIIRESFLV